jgi:beta-N-acetylhexosaminidase
MVDGLLLSHIRYQGFQGNIRATTKPVSFDAAALDLIMKLPEFSDWRSEGGIIVSEDLGSEAVRKFFDPLNTGFDARQVARSALLAGNDLLNLGNIIATNDPDSYTTVVRIVEYFNQRYLDDPTFQTRVDKAVQNILIMKFKLYPAFQLEDILPVPEDLDSLGQSQSAVKR